MGVHGCFLLGVGLCISALKRGMYMPNASWRRWGVATASRGVSPPLQRERQRKWRGRSAAEVCTSEARKIGEWLAGARGYLPLAVLAVACSSRRGVAGRADRPAEVGAEDAKQPQTGGDFLPRDSYLAISKRELYTNFNKGWRFPGTIVLHHSQLRFSLLALERGEF